MYKMGLLGGARTKSANVVGQTMKLNPHGDAAIYETLVRLARGNSALLHPYIDSKGNFGKQYSRDMRYAAAGYTEVKLEKLCDEIFRDVDKNTVDFMDNYDGTMKNLCFCLQLSQVSCQCQSGNRSRYGQQLMQLQPSRGM